MGSGMGSGRVVVMTGAARGIGRAAARRFAAEGCRLVLGDRDREKLSDALSALTLSGVVADVVVGDVGDPDHAQALVARALERHGRLDVAINNAGVVHPFAKLVDLDAAAMEAMFRVNVMGVFHGMRAQIPVMERRFRETGEPGAILNVASVAGLVGAPLLSAYAAAKHAVVGLTRSAAVETARRGVRINALCPSFADTGMVQGLVEAMGGEPDDAVARIVGAIPMRRLATPDEIVDAMVWITSPASTFLTGQAIALDGGLTAL